MDGNNQAGIRYALQNKYGLRVVTGTQVMIVSTLIKHPGLNAGKVVKILNNSQVSPITLYKSYKGLRDKGVIDEYGYITFIGRDMVPRTNGDRINYPLVSFVYERVMPPEQCEWAHLAAYIATQADPVGICEALKKVIDPAEQLDMLYEMQNGLAFCSIMAGDVSNWADMKGETELSPESKKLLKKAGKKI